MHPTNTDTNADHEPYVSSFPKHHTPMSSPLHGSGGQLVAFSQTSPPSESTEDDFGDASVNQALIKYVVDVY